MSEVAFTILQRPDGKWTLTKGGVHMGIFETVAEAEEAMHIVIVPNIRHYNADGELID